MKRLGLIGGTSWHSTIEYYRHINSKVNEHFGDNTNPPLMVYTMNQSLVHRYQREGNWQGIAEMIIDAASRLEKAGVDKLMFCANTPHKVYSIVQQKIKTPILHIADATAAAIKTKGIDTVCFLGTKYSMTEDFVIQRIRDNDVKVLAPEKENVIEELHRIIQEELTFGKIVPSSKEYVSNTIQQFVTQGAEGVILGCTEFPLMIEEKDLDIPIFDTTKIHALAGAKFILSDSIQ